jgi:hypothetical protein
MAWLRERSKRDSSTAQTDAFAGAKVEETVGRVPELARIAGQVRY